MEKRADHHTRAIVNLALALAKTSIEGAAEFMHEHNVPLHVAVRVLLGNPKPMYWSKS